jgi:hypothetical protein
VFEEFCQVLGWGTVGAELGAKGVEADLDEVFGVADQAGANR